MLLIFKIIGAVIVIVLLSSFIFGLVSLLSDIVDYYDYEDYWHYIDFWK